MSHLLYLLWKKCKVCGVPFFAARLLMEWAVTSLKGPMIPDENLVATAWNVMKGHTTYHMCLTITVFELTFSQVNRCKCFLSNGSSAFWWSLSAQTSIRCAVIAMWRSHWLTHWSLGDLDEIWIIDFRYDFIDWWQRCLLWHCPQMNITRGWVGGGVGGWGG